MKPGIGKSRFSKKKQKNPHRYIDFALRRGLTNPLIGRAMWPTKELTESLGIFFAIRRHPEINKKRYDTTVAVYCIGDGRTPRTASLMSELSGWTIHSIDPQLDEFKTRRIWGENYKNADRIKIHRQKSEDFTDFDIKASLSIIIAVHSHAPFEEFWNRVPFPKFAVAIPCCFPHHITDRPPVEVWEDKYILSEKRSVMVWKDYCPETLS